MDHEDFVLSLLCKSLINRRLFKVEVGSEAVDETLQQNVLKDTYSVSISVWEKLNI